MATKMKPRTARLVTTEAVGKEGHTKAHYRFDKCFHMEEKLYAPEKTPRLTRKVRCYQCERFRVLCGF